MLQVDEVFDSFILGGGIAYYPTLFFMRKIFKVSRYLSKGRDYNIEAT